MSQLQSEVENLALRLFYMQEVNADLRSDITAMKNASRKAYSEKTQAEEQKHKQVRTHAFLLLQLIQDQLIGMLVLMLTVLSQTAKLVLDQMLRV